MKYLGNAPFFNWIEALIDDLPEEYRSLSSSDYPEVEEEDQIIGQLSPTNTLLFGAFRSADDKARAFIASHKEKCSGDDGCGSFREEAKDLIARSERLREIFWMSVRHDCGEYPSITIRKGGQIVVAKDDGSSGVMAGGVMIIGSGLGGLDDLAGLFR